MAKVIHTTSDAEGNVEADFDGFYQMDGLVEEAQFRRELAALGLVVDGFQSDSRYPSPESNSIKPGDRLESGRNLRQ